MRVQNKKKVPPPKKVYSIRIGGELYSYSNTDMKIFDSRAVHNIKEKAKKLDLPCTLTTKDLRNWWLTTPDKCSYCGSTVDEYLKMSEFIIQYTGDDPTIIRFKSAFNLPNHRNIKTMLKDRIDKRKGYTIDNIHKTCWLCKYMKGQNFTSDEWKLIAPVIMKKLKEEINQKGDKL